jgi:hypothetical protein
LRAKKPGSPRLEDDHVRAVAQAQADQKAFERGETALAADEREYKKLFFLTVLSALEQFAAGRVAGAEGLALIATELHEAGGEMPELEDSGLDALQHSSRRCRGSRLSE